MVFPTRAMRWIALIATWAGSARADDAATSAPVTAPAGVQAQAPWLKPWLPPPQPDLDPVLADGLHVAIDVGTGISVSEFATSGALSETGEVGWCLASSTKQALSIAAVEKFQLAIDHTTPELGVLGAGLRRVGRRNIGSTRTVDFERLHAGLGFTTRGSNLDAGLGAGLAFGFMSFKGTGIDVSLDSYFLAPSNLGGPEKLFMITVGFVYSPIPGVHAAPPISAAAPVEHREPTRRPCRDLAAYQDALVRERKIAVESCNKGPSPACDTSKAIVTSLGTKARACYEGEDVGPPTETDDAPVP